jgi:hypothetical protein
MTKTTLELPKSIRNFIAEVSGQDPRVANRLAGFLEGHELSLEGATLIVEVARIEVVGDKGTVNPAQPHRNGTRKVS